MKQELISDVHKAVMDTIREGGRCVHTFNYPDEDPYLPYANYRLISYWNVDPSHIYLKEIDGNYVLRIAVLPLKHGMIHYELVTLSGAKVASGVEQDLLQRMESWLGAVNDAFRVTGLDTIQMSLSSFFIDGDRHGSRWDIPMKD